MFHWLRRLFVPLVRWWRRRRRHDDFPGYVFLDPATDPAPALADRQLVLVGDPSKPKWLRFACPCRCGQVIALNLMKSHSPHWSVTTHEDGTLTIFPSVDSTTCGSHFWIRRSRIEWV